MERAGLFRDGEFAEVKAERWIDVLNPATEEVIARVPACGAGEVDAAVGAARACWEAGEWSGLTGGQRAVCLRAVAREVAARKDELAVLETLDNGKPVKESEWDVDDVVGCFEYFAAQAEALDAAQGKAVDVGDADYKVTMHYEAAGVVVAIVPFNYPLLMAAWKVAPALAAGCTVVLKPSEVTPLTALELCRITAAAGLPKGVLNLVTGDGETGSLLTHHPLVDKVAFTGSVPTGIRVAHAAIDKVNNVTLELGGKSSIIVFDDVDVEKTVEWVMFGCFWTNGQICSATSRLLVHEAIAEQFIARLVEATQQIPIADPNAPDMKEACGFLGPVVSAKQLARVNAFIQDALGEGARLLTGGKRPAKLPRGYFVEPTILETEPHMTIWNEEVFGPVLCVKTFGSEREALELANDSKYGLAGAVMSADKERCARVVRGLRCGITWANCSQPCFVQVPWGGMKRSGVGRELGERGIYNYLEPKQVVEYVSAAPLGWYDLQARL